MKKILKVLLGTTFLVLLMTLFLGNNVLAATMNCTITFEDSEGGNEHYIIKYDDDTTSDKLYSGSSVESGNKITLQASPEEGYRFAYWLYNVYGETKKLSEKTSVTFTIKHSYTFTAVYVKEGSYVVTFGDNSEDVIYDYQIVEKGENAKSIDIPSKKGYSKRGWSASLNNITEDLYLKPVYKATVWSVFRDYAPDFFKGLGLTLAFSVISVFLALFLGAVLCLLRISSIKPLSFLSGAYIEIVRGVPLLLQLLLIYALMPRIAYGKFLNSEVIAAILTLFLNSGAYVAEIFRAGIQAVDKGQMEAGRALGLSKWTTMKKIILPQAVKNVLPSIGNELIMVIKETSLASTVDAGIGELMSVKKQITSATFINIPPFIVIAAMYFVVTFTLSKVVRYIERRLEARD